MYKPKVVIPAAIPSAPKRFKAPQVPASPSIAVLPHLLNIKEAAEVLHVSVRTVHTIIAKKQLTYFHVRGQLRFDPAHLNEYLQRRIVRAA
jgi:excisionase family DNA binding protein